MIRLAAAHGAAGDGATVEIKMLSAPLRERRLNRRRTLNAESITTAPLPTPPPVTDTYRPDGHKVGMITFFVSEVAFFSTLITAYLIYMGQDVLGPTPAEALSLNLVIINTICLLSSSVTVHFAEMALRRGNGFLFSVLWMLTILLGAAFIAGTGFEWYTLITDPEQPLTIGRNLFGSTFYTLVGFHGAHVTIGLILLSLILVLYWNGQVTAKTVGLGLVGWYWHFVDVVWIVVFVIVYIIGR